MNDSQHFSSCSISISNYGKAWLAVRSTLRSICFTVFIMSVRKQKLGTYGSYYLLVSSKKNKSINVPLIGSSSGCCVKHQFSLKKKKTRLVSDLLSIQLVSMSDYILFRVTGGGGGVSKFKQSERWVKAWTLSKPHRDHAQSNLGLI